MSVQLPSRTIHCQMNRSTVATEKCTKQLIGERRFKPWISLLELEYAHCTEISCRQTNTCTLFFLYYIFCFFTVSIQRHDECHVPESIVSSEFRQFRQRFETNS